MNGESEPKVEITLYGGPMDGNVLHVDPAVTELVIYRGGLPAQKSGKYLKGADNVWRWEAT